MSLIAYVFEISETADNVDSYMGKVSRFRTLIDSQHVKGSQISLQSARQLFHQILL